MEQIFRCGPTGLQTLSPTLDPNWVVRRSVKRPCARVSITRDPLRRTNWAACCAEAKISRYGQHITQLAGFHMLVGPNYLSQPWHTHEQNESDPSSPIHTQDLHSCCQPHAHTSQVSAAAPQACSTADATPPCTNVTQASMRASALASVGHMAEFEKQNKDRASSTTPPPPVNLAFYRQTSGSKSGTPPKSAEDKGYLWVSFSDHPNIQTGSAMPASRSGRGGKLGLDAPEPLVQGSVYRQHQRGACIWSNGGECNSLCHQPCQQPLFLGVCEM